MEVVKLAMMLRILRNSLLQAGFLGLVAIFIFDGVWLWIALAIMLALILSFVRLAKLGATFRDKKE